MQSVYLSETIIPGRGRDEAPAPPSLRFQQFLRALVHIYLFGCCFSFAVTRVIGGDASFSFFFASLAFY